MTTAQDYSRKSNFEEEKILAIRKLDRKTRKKIYNQLGLRATTDWIQKGALNTYGPMRGQDDWVRNFDKAYIRKELEYSVMIGLAYFELFGDVAHVFIRHHDEKPVIGLRSKLSRMTSLDKRHKQLSCSQKVQSWLTKLTLTICGLLRRILSCRISRGEES